MKKTKLWPGLPTRPRLDFPHCLILAAASLVLTAYSAAADDACKSGLEPGRRPGPYSALVTYGPQRGQSHCFICETGDRPSIIVFARGKSEPLGKLLKLFDRSLVKYRDEDIRGWATFLSANEPELEPQLLDWARALRLSSKLSLGIFEDVDGPPSYCLNRDANVTVLLSVNQKVKANFAFRTGELNDEKIEVIMARLPEILKIKLEE